MRRDELMDRLLDEALSSYASQAPRPGLEQRVLDRVHRAGRARRLAFPRFPRWAMAVGIAFGLLLAGIFLRPRRAKPDGFRATRSMARIPAAAAARGQADARPLAARASKKKRRRAPALPRLPEFPTPAAITDEERALLALVAGAPREARDVFGEMRRRSAEPIRIEAIKIQPLESDGWQ